MVTCLVSFSLLNVDCDLHLLTLDLVVVCFSTSAAVDGLFFLLVERVDALVSTRLGAAMVLIATYIGEFGFPCSASRVLGSGHEV